MKEKIEQAVERSISHNERVTVTVRDVDEALTTLCGIPGYMVDSTQTKQGLDAWGYTEDTPEHEMDWRLLLVQAEAQ